jgi:hypothetical protein
MVRRRNNANKKPSLEEEVPANIPGVRIADISVPNESIVADTQVEGQLAPANEPSPTPAPAPAPAPPLPLPTTSLTANPATNGRALPLAWTHEMEQVLFSELMDQARDGKRADAGFKKEAWVAVREEVQRVYTGPPVYITIDKLKSKELVYKGLYKDWKFLRDQSGFGWDEETQMITASDQAWDDIIKVPSALFY